MFTNFCGLNRAVSVTIRVTFFFNQDHQIKAIKLLLEVNEFYLFTWNVEEER